MYISICRYIYIYTHTQTQVVLPVLPALEDLMTCDAGARDGAEGDGPVGVRNITCQEHHTGADDGDEHDGPAGVRTITRQEHHIAAEPGGGVGLSLTARDLSKWSVLHHAAFHGQVVLPTCDAPDL